MKIVAFSDTHGYHRAVTLPHGDVLVFAGDLMTSGYNHREVVDFANWFTSQPHKHKILVAGNHDRLFQQRLDTVLPYFNSSVFYIQDSGVTIDGVKFWGSPWQPDFCNWAFNLPRGEELRKVWAKVPEDTDVLITHGPPYGYRDNTGSTRGNENVGDEELEKALYRIKPRAHIFGHIHNGHGIEFFPKMYVEPNGFFTVCYNVAICDEEYRPVNEPHIIEIQPKE